MAGNDASVHAGFPIWIRYLVQRYDASNIFVTTSGANRRPFILANAYNLYCTMHMCIYNEERS